MNVKLGKLMVAVAPVALAVNTAWAQTPSDEAEQNPQIESPKVDEVIIVTGVLGNKMLKQDATFSINTMDEAEIKRLAPISTADLLQNVPGIFAEGSTAGEASNNITVRGLPVTGGYRYAPQLIDGLPWFEEPEVQFMNNDSAVRGDLMTERVEVVKGGTGGILYSNGLGATVNHVTRTGGDEFEGAYKLEVADYNFMRHDFYVSGPINDNLTYAIGGFFRQSDGIRDTGYRADDGGQIRGNLVWSSDDEGTELQVHFLTIDDHTGFFQNVPFLVPGFDERGTAENPIYIDQDQVFPLGIDFGDGTVASPFNQHFTQLGEYGSRDIDLQDGLHADFDVYTFKVRHLFADYWTLNAGLRHSEGSNNFNAMFTGNDSNSAENFLNARWQNDVIGPAHGQALRGEFDAAKLAGFFDVPDNAAQVFDGISRDDFVNGYAKGVGVEAFYLHDGTQVADDTIINFLLPFITRTNAKSTSFDINLQRDFEFQGEHTLTFGYYLSDYEVDQSFQSSLLVSTMEDRSKLVDLYVVDDDGQKVGPAITMDGAILPGFFGYVSDIQAEGKAFYIHDHWELLDGDLKIDMGYRWQSLEASVFRLDRNITDDSNFTPADVTPGSADDLTTADDEVFLPSNPRESDNRFHGKGWSIGANYAVSSNFAVYGLVSNSFRLPSLEDLNEFRVDSSREEEQVEQIWQYETGVRYFADTWDTQIALFYNEFSPRENSIEFRDFTSPECVVNDNLPDINTCPLVTEFFERGIENLGFEIEFSWRPDAVAGLELRGNLVWQDPEIVGANYRVVNTIIENDVTVGYEFREIGENGRTPRRLAEAMLNLQSTWDLKPLTGYPIKPYLKYTWFDERFSESSDFDVTVYPAYFHLDGGVIWDVNDDLAVQFHVSNITDELSFTEGDPLIETLKGPDGTTNRGVARPLFGRVMRAMVTYRF